MRTVSDAKAFANNAHGDQRYGENTYLFHLESVALVLEAYGHISYSLQAAAYLHDTLEDTPTKYADLKSKFGHNVAELVYAVTDELGRNRKERHEKTYPKIKACPGALTLKLADRIANVTYSHMCGDVDKLEMYQKEYSGFCSVLRETHVTPVSPMWAELDDLLYRRGFPDLPIAIGSRTPPDLVKELKFTEKLYVERIINAHADHI